MKMEFKSSKWRQHITNNTAHLYQKINTSKERLKHKKKKKPQNEGEIAAKYQPLKTWY